MLRPDSYDVAIIGAGPVGCAAALACARRGQRVLLLEQDPGGAVERVVGEWLHPPAMDVLDDLGVDLKPPIAYPTGKGFVVFSDDGEEPIVLPYSAERFGFSVEHGLLVETLRAHCERHEGIEYAPYARAVRVERDALTFERRAPGTAGTARTIRAERIVGASGTALRTISYGDVVTLAQAELRASHRIAGLALHGVSLPFEGYLHLAIGGAGPMMAYRIGPARVRLLLDVPLSSRIPREGGVALFEAYAPALPEALVDAFRDAVRSQSPVWSHGELRPRTSPIRDGIVWIGDAARSYHPLAAIDLTLGLGDAAAVATAKTPAAYARARKQRTRVAETIAVGLHELFADPAPESIALRRATYRLWREEPSERLRTMGFMAGDGAGPLRFGRSCLSVMARAAGRTWIDGAKSGEVRHAREVSVDLSRRIGWMMGGVLGWTEALPRNWEERLGLRGAGRYGAAIHAAESVGEVVGLPTHGRATHVDSALERARTALLMEQNDDGSFEGEVVWCPMLAAQYVLACHVVEHPIAPERRAMLLLHFEKTRLANGAWGIHEKSGRYLFVTALVYAAARLLGLSKDDPLLAGAHAFLRAEGGAVRIPSWGKLWLALVGLYEWDGVSAIVPELWSAPRWMPVHPSNYYCHTRLIYLGMAALYAERYQRPPTPTIRALRDEIFVEPYEEIDFAAAREALRAEEIHVPPSTPLKIAQRGLGLLDRARTRSAREGLLRQLRERIRFELRSTSHTCISPTSGLLDIVALWIDDHEDPDVAKALERFDGWIWEDETDGARVCGGRSATWDTSFAVQALIASGERSSEALAQADAFLRAQQIRSATGREHEHDRIDPTGGYAFSGAWNGWPVSDATAEAMIARLSIGRASAREMEEAARFILRTQNADGGFGSYEARRAEVPIEWLNPSEMFGGCMSERSYVECTSAAISALAMFRERHPERLHDEISRAIEGGVACLRRMQRPDGSWPGTWGVYFVYGTMFGVRGLLAGGVPSVDPQVRRACAWLKERQRADGAWGEHYSSATAGHYVEHEEPQVIQTAWAMIALLTARDPEFAAVERAARFLANAQAEDGTWPKQDPCAIFFDTALLDYQLYRSYFPLSALALYAERAAVRAASDAKKPTRAPRDIRPS